jgi:hypothetical protein
MVKSRTQIVDSVSDHTAPRRNGPNTGTKAPLASPALAVSLCLGDDQFRVSFDPSPNRPVKRLGVFFRTTDFEFETLRAHGLPKWEAPIRGRPAAPNVRGREHDPGSARPGLSQHLRRAHSFHGGRVRRVRCSPPARADAMQGSRRYIEVLSAAMNLLPKERRAPPTRTPAFGN